MMRTSRKHTPETGRSKYEPSILGEATKHYVTKEKVADGHCMVKVAGCAVTETCEKRQAKQLVRAIRGLRRLKKVKKQAAGRHRS